MITVKSFITNFFSMNTWLLYDDSNEAVLIDCGCVTPEEEIEFMRFITANNLTLKRYLCTHLHLDHILGSDFIYRTYGIKPEAHKADVELLPPASQQARSMGIPIEIKDVEVEKFLVDGETISFGHSELQVLGMPGHSPGGLAFYNPKNGYLFAGDSLFAGSIGRTDLWQGNMDLLLAAINNKLLTLPDSTIVYPGHGPSTTIFAEKRGNPFL